MLISGFFSPVLKQIRGIPLLATCDMIVYLLVVNNTRTHAAVGQWADGEEGMPFSGASACAN